MLDDSKTKEAGAEIFGLQSKTTISLNLKEYVKVFRVKLRAIQHYTIYIPIYSGSQAAQWQFFH